MKWNKTLWLWAAFTVCFFAVGIPYWTIPYNKVNLPNGLLTPGLILVSVLSLILCATRVATFLKVVIWVGVSIPAAVMARVLVEGIMDPTSHNLWPLEVIIAVFVGLAPALAGGVAGLLIAKLINNH